MCQYPKVMLNRGHLHDEFYQNIVKSVPLGRIAEPVDVPNPVLFLCSSGSDFITGQTLVVDGGATVI